MRTLVIGYGNPVRSDDGAGIAVAREVEKLDLPGVEVRTVQQLHVDLAEDLPAFDRVIFVDASESGPEIGMNRIKPEEAAALSSSHYLGPGMLGSLAKKIYGMAPELFVCAVRGEEFGFGNTLSAACHSRVPLAVKAIARLQDTEVPHA